MPAFWALKGIISHSKKEKLTLGIEIKENPVFGFWDCFMERTVNLLVPGIKTIIPGHLQLFFRDMLNQQFNEINGRKFDDGFGVAEIGLCINIESMFVFMVNVSFNLFERGADEFFKFI